MGASRSTEEDSAPVSYLQCPECRLTVPAAAYYLRGDECPRCLTTMEPAARFRREPEPAVSLPTPPPASGGRPAAPAAG